MATESDSDPFEAAAAAEQGSGGLPQLDFQTWPSQIIWLAFALVVLYQLMTKIALPRISSVLEERADAIADDLDKAEEFKRRAEEAQKQYDKALAEARQRAQEIAAQTRAEIDKEVQKEMAKADEEIAARASESERRIREIRDSALESIEAVAKDTAGAVIEAVMPGLSDQKAVDKAVQSRLK